MIIKPFYIYVLELSNNKYYVGKTSKNVMTRFNKHVKGSGFGSSWTRLHTPLKILEQFETVDVFDEDKYTKKYMEKYGIENVRGGSYCKIILDDWQIKALKNELMTTNNLCFNCGKHGHFASNCKKK